MPELMSASRPDPLRLLGFAAVALGGLLIAVGSLTTWATVRVRAPGTSALDTPFVGIDLWEGKVALALGASMLVAILVMRLVSRPRTVAAVILACSLGAAVIGVVDLVSRDSRFADPGAEAIAKALSHGSADQFARILRAIQAKRRELFRTDQGPGLWLLISGGALGAAGGALSMAWAGRRKDPPEPSEDLHPAAAS